MVRFLDGGTRDKRGRILSHAVSLFPIPSHFPHPKADISPDSKLRGSSPDALGQKFLESCTILSRFVPPGPRGIAGGATELRGKCPDEGTFSHCFHTTMVRRRHKAWQGASVIKTSRCDCPAAMGWTIVESLSDCSWLVCRAIGSLKLHPSTSSG